MDALGTKAILGRAMHGGYGVGAFNCRYPMMIPAVLAAAEAERSPVIIQISQLELDWLGLDPDGFLDEVRRETADRHISIPFALHLDHGWDLNTVEQAVKAGFSSVMLDTSSRTLRRNIEAVRGVVEMAHGDGVAVEAELGHVDGARRPVTAKDAALYTEAVAAEVFVRETKCDFLAVSVGTAHGVYRVRAPRIDFPLLDELSRRTGIPLVLHDAHEVAEDDLHLAMSMAGGGICKLSIDIELELTLLRALGVAGRLPPEEVAGLSETDRKSAHNAIVKLVRDKMRLVLASSGKA